MNLTPTRDNVLIRFVNQKQERANELGIEIVEKRKNRPDFGQVIDIGERVTHVKPGDYIHFEKLGAVEVDLPGHEGEYLIKEKNIIAIQKELV